jgi:hypothetical protein
MPKNVLVLRASPDWATFEIDRSRDFLKSLRLPEDLIVEFAALWSRHFKTDYRDVRAQLKEIAIGTLRAVRQTSFVRHQDWDGDGAEGRIAFVDDDDWMAPDLFEGLPELIPGEDGTRWGSLRLGRVFGPNGYAIPILQRRPLDAVVYTNNYAVTSKAIGRLGRPALFEHDAAQRSFDRPDFVYTASQQYLSCAVKHPCSTMSVNFLMSQPNFRDNPHREMIDFMAAVDAMHLNDMEAWLLEPFDQFRQVMADALRPR